MSLNSENIQKKEFHIVFKGYKPEEVDKFLDMLAVEFDGMQKKISELEEKVDSLKYEGDTESSKMKKVIQEALISAHRMAEEIKQKARIEAEELVSKKKMEEEKVLRDLKGEKSSLETSISRLKDEYTSFKDQISRFADDFKQKTMSLGDEKLLDALKDVEKSQPEKDMTGAGESTGKETGASGKRAEESQPQSGGEVIYKHASREDSNNTIGDNDLKDLAALTDEMLEKLEKRDKGETPEKNTGETDTGDTGTGRAGTEKEDQQASGEGEQKPDEKRNRKKIDIANPDIINDFFKTEED